MKDKIEKVLTDKVNPLLEAHYGGAVLVSYDNGIAKVRLTGACRTCPSAQYTTEDIIKEILMSELPEIKDVLLDTSISQDLMDMAKKILNKEI